MYVYSENIGMLSDRSSGDDTEEEAVLRFYKRKRNSIINNISKYTETIQKLKSDLEALDKKYGSLKELFPEDFI